MSAQISESVIEICQHYGMQFKKQGGELYAKCPFHTDGSRPNFRVNIGKNSWFCDVCGEGGGAVEFLAKKQGRDKKEVFKELVQKNDNSPKPAQIVATYDYTDQFGKLLYQVCRMQPKTFRQRRPDGKGGWLWNMEGVERVLYRLQDILKPQNKHIWIVEGEKDVESIRAAGMAATCNVGGAGKWSDGYSACLKGKDVLICGDNDEPGRKHMQSVLESVETQANSVRKIEIPQEFKDVSDYLQTVGGDKEKALAALAELVDKAQVLLKVAALPIKGIAEMEAEYIEEVVNSKNCLVRLSNWLPSLWCVRPLVRGELVTIVGDTGTAKTYVLQHLAKLCAVPTLLFELELPGSLTFERFLSITHRKSGTQVFDEYERGNRMDYSQLSHIYTCTKSGLNPAEIESIIAKAELRMGMRPVLVLVDYVQLVNGAGRSRYEQVSAAAEQMKVAAKNTGTVIVMASQLGRDKENPEVNLHDPKGSGSIENSSGVVIGIWRDPQQAGILNVKVLKNTKGRPSDVIRCTIDTHCMWIEQERPET